MALSIGAISALVFSLLGPALQFLISPPEDGQLVKFDEMLGDRWAAIFGFISGQNAMTVDQLWSGLPVLLVLMALLRALLLIGQWWIWEFVSEGFAYQIRSKLVSAFVYLMPAKRHQLKLQEEQLASSISNDVRLLREYVVHFYGGLPRELIQVIFYLVSLVLLSPTLLVVFVFGLSPAILALNRLGKKIRRRSERALDHYALLAEWLQQRLRGIETIKHFRTEQYEINNMEQLSEELKDTFLRSAKAKTRSGPTLELIAVISLVVVLYVSLQMVAKGLVTASVLISFFAVLAILSQSASKLGRYFSANREGAAAIKRIDSLLSNITEHQQTEISPESRAKLGENALVLSELSASYHPEQRVLKSISFTFEKGQIYCVCGPSGSGKSTLFQVILGMLVPSEGRILIDSSLPTDRQKLIGYLPQSINLAPISLAHNIAYPESNPDKKKIAEAMRKAGLDHDFALTMDDDLTDFGGGRGLSGGQAQRVLMARLFYHRFPIILFDEGTSSLDPQTEALVFRSLKALAEDGSCIIMIAHRLSATRYADQILLIKEGEIKAHGNSEMVVQSDEFMSFMNQTKDM